MGDKKLTALVKKKTFWARLITVLDVFGAIKFFSVFSFFCEGRFPETVKNCLKRFSLTLTDRRTARGHRRRRSDGAVRKRTKTLLLLLLLSSFLLLLLLLL